MAWAASCTFSAERRNASIPIISRPDGTRRGCPLESVSGGDKVISSARTTPPMTDILPIPSENNSFSMLSLPQKTALPEFIQELDQFE
jgi:hypothetical protein